MKHEIKDNRPWQALYKQDPRAYLAGEIDYATKKLGYVPAGLSLTSAYWDLMDALTMPASPEVAMARLGAMATLCKEICDELKRSGD